jgi:hypothetical protein
MAQSTDLGFGEHNLIDEEEKDRFPIRLISVGMGGETQSKSKDNIHVC